MDEEEEHKAQISCLPDKIEGGKLPTKPEGSLSSEKKKSIQYLSDEYEDLMSFRNKTKNDLKLAIERLELVEKKCLELTAAIEAFEAFENYSYRNNLKIMELPGHAERESAEQTAALCLRLFRALGVEDISMLDIDTAHRVPDRQATNKPNATTCKFTRCLEKDKVISKKRWVSTLKASDLGFEDDVRIDDFAMFDYLSPRLQLLLYKAKKSKNENHFKFGCCSLVPRP